MQLHEQTQQFILLLIFYLLGPMLTLGIIGGVVLRKLPANARNWERALTQQTGLHWEIESVEYRLPGFVRLHKVQIKDDATKPPFPSIFYAEQVDIRRVTNTSRDKIFPGISTVSGDESPAWSGLTGVLTSSLPSFGTEDVFWQISVSRSKSILNLGDYSGENSALLVQNMLRKVFARFETLADVPMQFVVEEIYVINEHSLKRGGDKIEADLFRLVQGNIYRTPSAIRSDWSFEIPSISNTDRLQISFTLSLSDSLEVAFRTGKQPIPCDLAAVFYSPFQHFSGGTLEGEFTLSTRSGHNSQTILMNNVIVRNVPLAPLVNTYTDFAVEGTIVDLQFDQAVFGAGDISAKGRLQVQNGAVEKTLFHRCVGNFGLSVQPENILEAPVQMVPFTACVVWFHLQPEGIDFSADKIWLDAIMYQGTDTSSRADWVVRLPPHRQRVTYHEFMSVFAPDNAPTVPLTPGTQSILSLVPIP